MEGVRYDKEIIDGDIRSMVKTYSKAGGFVYDQQPPRSPDPDTLQIETKIVYTSSSLDISIGFTRCREGQSVSRGADFL